jgi:microcystin-dependent protein
MAQPYIGEIRMVGFSFPPAGWLFCDGQLLPISENDALFTLIGTTYGGDGQETFGLPNLQSRVPVHIGPQHQLAQAAGSEDVTLTTQQIPTHTHQMLATNNLGTAKIPTGQVLAQSSTGSLYQLGDVDVTMAANSITPVGGSQPHTNLQPYLTISFIISLFGIFPSQT